MTRPEELHRRWSREPGYQAAYDALEEEFRIARAMIEARKKAGLSQKELAKRMGTSQSYIARLESGRVRPSTRALERLAAATGTRLTITFEPLEAWRPRG